MCKKLEHRSSNFTLICLIGIATIFRLTKDYNVVGKFRTSKLLNFSQDGKTFQYPAQRSNDPLQNCNVEEL